MTTGTSTFSDCFFTAASETIKIPHKILNALDRIKSNTNAFGMLLSFTANGMDLFQKSRNITSLDPAIRVFGSVGAVYNALQIGGTIHYLFERITAYKNGEEFFNIKNTFTDCMIEISFGVANLGSSLVWANQHKLIDLGKYTIKSIGGIAVGSLTLASVITVGAVAGFAGLTVGSLTKLTGATQLTRDEKISNVCKIAWSVSEIALMVIPAIGLAPAAPWIIAGTMFAKTAGITSFIYSTN